MGCLGRAMRIDAVVVNVVAVERGQFIMLGINFRAKMWWEEGRKTAVAAEDCYSSDEQR